MINISRMLCQHLVSLIVHKDKNFSLLHQDQHLLLEESKLELQNDDSHFFVFFRIVFVSSYLDSYCFRPPSPPTSSTSHMNIDSFRCISVLGRGHFGKVKFANCRILINNNDHQFFWFAVYYCFLKFILLSSLNPIK